MNKKEKEIKEEIFKKQKEILGDLLILNKGFEKYCVHFGHSEWLNDINNFKERYGFEKTKMES